MLYKLGLQRRISELELQVGADDDQWWYWDGEGYERGYVLILLVYWLKYYIHNSIK